MRALLQVGADGEEEWARCSGGGVGVGGPRLVAWLCQLLFFDARCKRESGEKTARELRRSQHTNDATLHRRCRPNGNDKHTPTLDKTTGHVLFQPTRQLHCDETTRKAKCDVELGVGVADDDSDL